MTSARLNSDIEPWRPNEFLKLKAIHAGLVQLREQAVARGRGVGKIEKAIASVQEMREKIEALILGAM